MSLLPRDFAAKETYRIQISFVDNIPDVEYNNVIHYYHHEQYLSIFLSNDVGVDIPYRNVLAIRTQYIA